MWHPDKNPSEIAQLKFQAISWAYEYLRNPTNRAEYDETGELPQEDQDVSEEGTTHWKSYFDEIFGRVDVKAINDFALKYKMSSEEEMDVLSNYERFKGDLIKMLEHVMLSEERDCLRWMDDYIKPAVESGKAKDYLDKASKVLTRIRTKLRKESVCAMMETGHPDEGSIDRPTEENQRKMKRRGNEVQPKAKSTQSEKSLGDETLVAALRARAATRNPFAALVARYGVSMDGDDPLDDKEFAVAQKKTKRKK